MGGFSNNLKPPSTPKIEKKSLVRFSIKDTDFLLRVLTVAKINGADIYQAVSTSDKLKNLHKQLTENTIEINT